VPPNDDAAFMFSCIDVGGATEPLNRMGQQHNGWEKNVGKKMIRENNKQDTMDALSGRRKWVSIRARYFQRFLRQCLVCQTASAGSTQSHSVLLCTTKRK
jgi:hypothetical protein